MANPAISAVIDQLNLQTRLFKNVVSEIKDADASKRFTDSTNHVAWLAGHTVSTRYMLANMFGVKASEPYPELFANGKGLDATATYPSLSELTKDWDSISASVISRLNELSDSDIAAAAPFPLPVADATMKGFVSFIAHHEAYTIGQLGLLRRLNGYPAMQYN